MRLARPCANGRAASPRSGLLFLCAESRSSTCGRPPIAPHGYCGGPATRRLSMIGCSAPRARSLRRDVRQGPLLFGRGRRRAPASPPLVDPRGATSTFRDLPGGLSRLGIERPSRYETRITSSREHLVVGRDVPLGEGPDERRALSGWLEVAVLGGVQPLHESHDPAAARPRSRRGQRRVPGGLALHARARALGRRLGTCSSLRTPASE